jgi:hypothetical protein
MYRDSTHTFLFCNPIVPAHLHRDALKRQIIKKDYYDFRQRLLRRALRRKVDKAGAREKPARGSKQDPIFDKEGPHPDPRTRASVKHSQCGSNRNERNNELFLANPIGLDNGAPNAQEAQFSNGAATTQRQGDMEGSDSDQSNIAGNISAHLIGVTPDCSWRWYAKENGMESRC